MSYEALGAIIIFTKGLGRVKTKQGEKMLNTIKWVSSLLIILSMILTAANIYPANLFIAVLPTIGWIYISFMWKDKALIAMNFTALTIYLLGITNYLHQ